METILRVKNVVKKFGNKVAVIILALTLNVVRFSVS